MIIRTMDLLEAIATATPVREKSSGHRCQANVGTDDDPRSCGEKMKRLDDWTFLCPTHGEMH